MRFGTKLQTSIYEPWKDSYLHYARLKNILYEGQSDEEWGERNESRFVEELDSELEKVTNQSPIQSIKIGSSVRRYMPSNAI